MSALVVYFSRKGYVRRAAEKIARARGADLCELKTTERTAGILGFWWCGRFGMHRWEMPVAPLPCDVAAYDTVVVCSPIWVFTFCAPVRAFLTAHRGKFRAIEYVLVHFSPPMSYPRAVARMDELAGVRGMRYTSMVCVWGKFLREKIFER